MPIYGNWRAPGFIEIGAKVEIKIVTSSVFLSVAAKIRNVVVQKPNAV